MPYLLTARNGVARDLKLPSHSYGPEGVVGYLEAKAQDLASYPPLPLVLRFFREVPPRAPPLVTHPDPRYTPSPYLHTLCLPLPTHPPSLRTLPLYTLPPLYTPFPLPSHPSLPKL